MSPSVEGAIRPIEGSTGRVEQLRAGRWVPLKLWWVPGETSASAHELHLLAETEVTPDGARLEPDPAARMQHLAEQARDSIGHWGLSATAMQLVEILCMLEPEDRWRWFVELTLPNTWALLQHAGEPAPLDTALEELVGLQLVEVQTGRDALGIVQYYTPNESVQPLVLQGMNPDHKHPMLHGFGVGWVSRFLNEETAPTKQTVRAGIAAAVYLLLLSQPRTAFELLEFKVLPVARRTGESSPVFEHMRRIVDYTGDEQLRIQLEQAQHASK